MVLLNAACHFHSWVQVDAELSVPAVTALLLSAAALALSATADQLMSGGLTRTAHEALVAAGPLGTGGCCTVCRWTVGAAAWDHMGGGTERAMLCGWGHHRCFLCCLAAAAAEQCTPHLCTAVVIETAVRGLSSPIAFVSAVACAIAGVFLRITAAAAAS